MIENYEKQISLLFKIGVKYYENSESSESQLTNIVTFEKGKEIGSKNYLNSYKIDTIPYIRVGDLVSNSISTFVEKDSILKLIDKSDILLALDGAPGRNSFGKQGAISSGIYMIKTLEQNKGLVYFAINSSQNIKIISDNSQGTTILHASKAIPFLVYKKLINDKIRTLNDLFKNMLSLKMKLDILYTQKSNLLNKYFSTN